MNYKLVAYLVFVSSLAGCRTAQKPRSIDISEKIAQNYWTNQFHFDYIQLRGKSTVTQSGKSNAVSMHIKMIKDSMVWAKFSLFGFGVQALITRDSFFMLNSLSQEYMKYDYAFLEQYLGYKPQISHLQNILVGNAPFPQKNYYLDDQVGLIAREGLSKNRITLNAEFRTLLSELLTQNMPQSAQIQYSEYQSFDQLGLLPQYVQIEVIQPDEEMVLELNYQNVNTTPFVSFPFNIPANSRKK